MSRPIKYIVIIFSILFLLVLIPTFIPLEKYKDLISSKVHDAIGRDLTINGKISLSLLPRPKVKVEDVTLSSLPDASYPHLIELESAEAAVAITPLFLGKVVISYVELQKPKVTLEKLKNGKGTWEFENKSAPVNNLPEPNDVDSKTNELPLNIKRIIMNKGEVKYIDGANKNSVQDIDLDVELENIKGPIDFDLAFKALDQKINLNGQLKEIGSVIPLIVELKAGGDKLKLEGTVDVNNSSFQGDINANGNLKNLKAIPANSLPEGLKEDYKFTAKISADKQNINSTDINFQMGAVSATGQANYAIEKTTGSLDLNVNPGKVIINISPEGAVNGYSTSKVKLQSNSIKPLLEALKLDLKDLPEFLSQAFSLVASLQYKDQELLLQNIDFNLGNANLQGMLGARNWADNLIIPYNLKTKSGEALVKLIGSAVPVSLGEVQVKGETSKKDQIIKTDTTISLAKSDISIKGDIDIKKDIEPNVTINARGNSLGQTIGQLNRKPSVKNLGSFNINSKVSGNLKKEIKVNVDKSSLAFGNESSNFSGSGNFKLDADKPKISMDFSISSLNLNALSDTTSSTSSAAGSSSSSTGGHWSREKIDLSFLNSLDGDFNLSIQKIISGSLIFDNFKTKLNISNGTLDLSSLTGNLYGGKVKGSARVVALKSGGGDISLKASLNGAQLRNIVPTQGKIKVTQGIIDFNADIKTKGDSEYAYANNLNGNVNLNGKDGRLSGLDLQKIVSALNNAKDLQSILRVLDNSFLKGETAFKTMENKIVIDNGIAKLVTSKLMANGGEANASGVIDLPKYVLDINAEVKVEVKNMPPFKAHLYGQLDNPQYKLDTSALQKYLVNNVLTGVIDSIKSGKTRPEDILKGILGGGKKASSEGEQSAQEQNNDAPPEKNEVNDLINKGLKSLFK